MESRVGSDSAWNRVEARLRSGRGEMVVVIARSIYQPILICQLRGWTCYRGAVSPIRLDWLPAGRLQLLPALARVSAGQLQLLPASGLHRRHSLAATLHLVAETAPHPHEPD